MEIIKTADQATYGLMAAGQRPYLRAWAVA